MLGSVLAATDPVAVVALLNDLGASPVLTMVIAGESMLNDGVRSSSSSSSSIVAAVVSDSSRCSTTRRRSHHRALAA